jgi:protein-S-isoprenylcysteine O-methyltransferase Ste14
VQKYFAAASLILFLVLVIIRILMLKKMGIEAVEFGKKDKKDFLIPPFALFYFYLITANAFDLPTVPGQVLFNLEVISWIGVVVCGIGMLFFVWALRSFKKSFRVGLAENTSQGLVTTGAFAVSRNPIYVAFAMTMIGQFLVFSSWILLIYIVAAILLFHRQVLREEKFLKEQYGNEYAEYHKRVKRYL